ncbi:unnamed protein product [Parajaminaea phylloscopi]
MGQEEFRKLLQRPAEASPSATAASQPRARAFGATQKRPHSSSHASSSLLASSSSTATPDAAGQRKARNGHSRDDQGDDDERSWRPKKNSATGDVYVDRASQRRSGQTDKTQADLVALHDEWQAKWLAAQTDEERRDIEAQMAFLGGDAKHSVLVKGLDFALLAQQRAKVEGRELPEAAAAASSVRLDADDELEAAYQQGGALAESSALPATAEAPPPTKRSRAEVLEALKRRKLNRTEPASSAASKEATGTEKQAQKDAEFERARQLGKFRPIGSESAGPSSETTQRSKDGVIITKDGKRLRKKVKKDSSTTAAAATAAAAAKEPDHRALGQHTEADTHSSAPVAAVVTEKTEIQQDLPGEGPASAPKCESAAPRPSMLPDLEASPPPLQPLRSPKESHLDAVVTTPAQTAGDEAASSFDPDEDVFADAGRWTGLHSDDEDDDEGSDKDASESATAARAGQEEKGDCSPGVTEKTDWFASTADESALAPGADDAERASSSSSVNRILSTVGLGVGGREISRQSSHQHAVSRLQTGSPPPPSSVQEPPSKTGRLQGLSDTALPSDFSRALLEHESDRAAKAEAKRMSNIRERAKLKKEKKKAAAASAGDSQ